MEDPDFVFMREAIRLSESAVRHGNEPFGAVLVKDGVIAAAGENEIYTAGDFTAHAELHLLQRYSRETGITDLGGYTLYASCEPCFMCSGALVWTKLGRLVYGASDLDLCALLGVEGSRCSSIVLAASHAATEVRGGVLREESLRVLRDYFAAHEKH